MRISDWSSDVCSSDLPSGAVGYLEAKVPAVGTHWIRTTDLAMIDEDGFIFHKGRGDGAILRGGFKVLPETIVQALTKHPAVRSEEHTSELQSLMRTSYAVFCLKKTRYIIQTQSSHTAVPSKYKHQVPQHNL